MIQKTSFFLCIVDKMFSKCNKVDFDSRLSFIQVLQFNISCSTILEPVETPMTMLNFVIQRN